MSSRYPNRDAYTGRSHLYGQAGAGPYASKANARPASYAYGQAPSGYSAGPSETAFRPAAPNSRGQYSAAVLEELESQNDAQVEGLRGKVKMLKEITEAIGTEVRESSSMMQAMNDQFENARIKVKGTVTRMMVMHQRSGIGWRAWILFFLLVIGIFGYVWLF